MSRDGVDSGTPPQDTGAPDQVERDPAALNSAEDLDEDRLGADPLEEGAEPPEGWSAGERYGNTPYEQSAGEDLDRKVAAERPDVDEAPEPEEPPD
jgi:hypothetical protein